MNKYHTEEYRRAVRKWLRGLRKQDISAAKSAVSHDELLGLLQTGGKTGIMPKFELSDPPDDGSYPDEGTECDTLSQEETNEVNRRNHNSRRS